MQELPDHGFAGNQVAVRFDEHAALNFPTAFFHPLADFFEQFRIILFDLQIKIRLRRPEFVIRIFLHQGELTGKRPRGFPRAFPDRPQPADINMRVPDRISRQHPVFSFPLKHAIPQDLACRGCIGRVMVVDVRCAVQFVEQLFAAVIIRTNRFQQTRQRFDFEQEQPDFTVEYAQPERGDAGIVKTQRLRGRFLFRRRQGDPRQTVRRSLEPDIDPVARFQIFQRKTVFAVTGIVNTPVGQAAGRNSGFVKDQDLAFGIEPQTEFFSGKGFRHDPRQMEPGAVPCFAPAVSFPDRTVLEFQTVAERDRLFGQRVFRGKFDGIGVDFLKTTCGERFHPVQKNFEDFFVHGCFLFGLRNQYFFRRIKYRFG